MGKIFLFIVGGYVLYYLSQIIYDGFLKKSPVVKNQDEGELISLADLSDVEKTDIKSVSIEEAENVNLPKSMQTTEHKEVVNQETIEPEDDDFDTSNFKDRYEEEISFEQYDVQEKIEAEEKELLKEEQQAKQSMFAKFSEQINVNAESVVSMTTELVTKTASDFEKFFENADQHYVVEEINGTTAYRSKTF